MLSNYYSDLREWVVRGNYGFGAAELGCCAQRFFEVEARTAAGMLGRVNAGVTLEEGRFGG